jgi:hypothetical protein
MASLPDPHMIRDLFAGLLGKDVTVKIGTPGAAAGGTVAVYATDEGTVAGLAVCDLALASNAGAALSLIPAGMAAESVRAGILADNLAENWREVLNVANQLFSSSGGHRVRLTDIGPADDPPPAAAKLLGSPRERLDVELQIAGYGSGKLSLLVG